MPYFYSRMVVFKLWKVKNFIEALLKFKIIIKTILIITSLQTSNNVFSKLDFLSYDIFPSQTRESLNYIYIQGRF